MLESAIALLQAVLVFVIGLVLRAAIAVAIIAAIALPIAGLLLAWRGAQRLGERASGLGQVGHIRWHRGNYYTPGHLWLRPRIGGRLRIGLDDVAQRVLPEVDEVTLPAPGTLLKKGDVLGLIRCLNGAVALRAPISGVVAAVNDAVREVPSLLHRDPYRRAWLVDVRPDGSDHTRLPSGRRARAWLAREDERLTGFLEHQLGIAAADGGEVMVPPHRLLSPEQWDTVRKGFLSDEYVEYAA
jgi:glycine cleavage system H lipoate-binding protein